MINEQEIIMLNESNAIEGIFDSQSLIDAIKAWVFLREQILLTPDDIKECHQILMENKNLPKKHIGDWRDVPVYIGGVCKFQPKIVIRSQMEDFCKDINGWINHSSLSYNKDIESIKQMHVRFETLHPFIDGNGRVGRMIMYWHYLQLKEDIKIIYEKDKQEYYDWFGNV